MATVKVDSFKEHGTETASDKIIKRSRETFTVIDSEGREIKVRSPNYLERTDFVAALGERGSLESYFSQVAPAMYVRSIDGDPIPQPANLADVRAILKRLDDEGVTAVLECVMENFVKNKTQDEEKDRLKK